MGRGSKEQCVNIRSEEPAGGFAGMRIRGTYGDYRDNIGVIWVLYRGSIGIIEENMETTL